MQASNLPFRYWFLAIHLLTSTKKTFSALEPQRQIGHKYYEPIWYMMQKLRATMGSRDSKYQLDKIVELDEGFFESVDTEKDDEEKFTPKKRGRGSQKQSTVLVMASTVHDFGKTKKFNKPTKFRYVRMLVVDNLKGETVGKKVIENNKYDTVVKTDHYASYSKLKAHVWCHISQKVSPKDSGKVLPWVHTMISNAKRTLLGVPHMISTKYIAGSAIVKGGIQGLGISNIWIGGRGIINVQQRLGRGGCVFNFTQCSNILIDGLTSIDEIGRAWAVRFTKSDHVTLSNFSLCGHLENSDGFHFDGSQNCIATGCFLRSSDDLMLVNGVSDGTENCTDNTFKNSVVWGDKAHIFVAGFNVNVNSNNITKNILFQNIDVINHREGDPGFRGVIEIWCTRNQTVRDITFNDIRIMSFQEPSQAKVLQIQLAPNYAYNAEGMPVRNITISNRSYAGSGEKQSLIYGQSNERFVDSKLFINYTRNASWWRIQQAVTSE